MGKELVTKGSRQTQSILVWILAISVTVATIIAAVIAWQNALGDDAPLWVMSRSTGIAAYVTLWLSSVFGLFVSHPDAHKWTLVNLATRLRLHIGLAITALFFTVMHLVVLAVDSYAKVGWLGALLPMQSEYRPVPVTFGVVAFWGMVIVAVSAGLSNTRLFQRSWLWMHRISISFFALAWFHGLLSGTDAPDLLVLYLSTGVFIVIFAVWRYVTPSLRSRRASYAKGSAPQLLENAR